MNRNRPGLHPYLRSRPWGPTSGWCLQRLRHDEPLQLDELMEQMEERAGSAEIFTALFELELSGKVKSLPGKNYVRAF